MTLTHGTRESGDLCYYPRSNKVSFRGLGVIVRVEPWTTDVED